MSPNLIFFFINQIPAESLPIKLIEHFLHSYPNFLHISKIDMEKYFSGAPYNSFNNRHTINYFDQFFCSFYLSIFKLKYLDIRKLDKICNANKNDCNIPAEQSKKRLSLTQRLETCVLQFSLPSQVRNSTRITTSFQII